MIKRLFGYCWMMGISLLLGCTSAPNEPLYQASATAYPYQQASFIEYRQQSIDWLKNNRVFLTADKTVEIEANAPFELRPEQEANRAVLLVHGLSGSPFFFRDIAKQLQAQGFLVRVMLLPGHGSRPGDMLVTSQVDWQKAVAHQISLLKQRVDDVWLGGFSTGANLVTSAAIEDSEIAGLMLFSPGFKSRQRGLALTPWVSQVIDWVDIDEPDGNYTVYGSLPFKGAASYYLSSKDVLHKLSAAKYSKPTLITISEDDVVIDPQATYQLFHRYFTHPSSQLIWYGAPQSFSDARVSYLNKQIESERISTFSHLNVLFSPDNDYYGKAGSYRFCEPDLDSVIYRECMTAEDVWFAEYGYREPGKIHARLLWNPYFEQLLQSLQQLVTR